MNLRILRVPAAALILAATLVACTKPTPYAPAGDNGYGFTEQKIEDQRYRVTFSGNSVTDRETVDNYLLYRAAELTVETGNDYFQIGSKETDTATTYNTSGPDVGVFGSRGGYGWGWGVGTTFGTATPVRSFEASAIVQLYKGERPADDPSYYDARAVLQNLGPQVKRPGQEDS